LSPTPRWAARARGGSSSPPKAPAPSSAASPCSAHALAGRWSPRPWARSAFAAPVALLALRAPVGAIAAAAAVSGIGIAVFGVLWDTTLQRHIPAAVLSRVSAYDWLGSVALIPLGYALTGPLAAALGTTGTLWLAAAWTVLGSATALAVPSVRRLQESRDQPTPADGHDLIEPTPTTGPLDPQATVPNPE